MKRTAKKALTLSLGLVLVLVMFLNLVSCDVSIKSTDMNKGIKANKADGIEGDEKYKCNLANFSFELFKRSISDEKNSLISPLSVMLALAMTTNGADNRTLTQMEEVLGGDIQIDELNEYLYNFTKNLPNKEKSKFEIANSIWIRDLGDLFKVKEDFLQKNADFYSAPAYKSAFDEQTLNDINNWVDEKTDGMIDKILKEISDDAMVYLINAIVFEAEWEMIYPENYVSESDFTNLNGSKVKVEMMRSEESKFLKDDSTIGFVKPYKNGDYSFVALLPNEDISLLDYVNSLTGEEFLNLLEGKEERVFASLPKFSYDYELSMNEALKDMGMLDAFDVDIADLSRLGESPLGNLYIYEVLHKTFISVAEKGTKAGAATKVEVGCGSGIKPETVYLDRPFVYAIIENNSNIPVFIGAIVDLGN